MISRISVPGQEVVLLQRRWGRWCFPWRWSAASQLEGPTSCSWAPECWGIGWNRWTRWCLKPCEKSELTSRWLYLWVGELQTGDGEHHLATRHQEVLRDLPGHVDGVGLDVFYLLDGASTLHATQRHAVVTWSSMISGNAIMAFGFRPKSVRLVMFTYILFMTVLQCLFATGLPDLHLKSSSLKFVIIKHIKY